MSDWSDLGLPAFEVPGYGYSIESSLIRTPFETPQPGQSRLNRANRKTFSAEVLLTQHELSIAETFLNTGAGYVGFTVGLLTGGGYVELGVRACEGFQVTPIGYNTYRLRLRLETA